MLEATTRTVPTSPGRISRYTGAWLALGTALALSGVLRDLPQLAGAFVISSAVAWTLAYRRSEEVRRWASALPMRAIIAAHALRLPIGAVFLWEASRGQLHPTFADRAGWGDIAVGAVALAVAIAGARRPRVVRAFAWFGLVDILIAFGTAMYLVFVVQDPVMVAALSRLPYPLLPMAVVPLVIVTHLLMLTRRSPSPAPHGARPSAPRDRR